MTIGSRSGQKEEAMSYTQNELCSVWKKLTDGTEHDEFDALDVCALISSRNLETLWARIANVGDLEQTLTFTASIGAVEPYKDKDTDSDSTIGYYTRKRGNKEAEWGDWEGQN
jgi:hypothetical protein